MSFLEPNATEQLEIAIHNGLPVKKAVGTYENGLPATYAPDGYTTANTDRTDSTYASPSFPEAYPHLNEAMQALAAEYARDNLSGDDQTLLLSVWNSAFNL